MIVVGDESYFNAEAECLEACFHAAAPRDPISFESGPPAETSAWDGVAGVRSTAEALLEARPGEIVVPASVRLTPDLRVPRAEEKSGGKRRTAILAT